MADRDVVICAPVRTAIGTFAGTQKDTPATELSATAIRAAMERAGLDPAKVDGVVMGNVIQAGNRMNPARQAAIGAGIPVSVPARSPPSTNSLPCWRAARPALTTSCSIRRRPGTRCACSAYQPPGRASSRQTKLVPPALARIRG